MVNQHNHRFQHYKECITYQCVSTLRCHARRQSFFVYSIIQVHQQGVEVLRDHRAYYIENDIRPQRGISFGDTKCRIITMLENVHIINILFMHVIKYENEMKVINHIFGYLSKNERQLKIGVCKLADAIAFSKNG